MSEPEDMLEPELEDAIAAAKPYSDKLEDALSMALFPPVAKAFLTARAEGKEPATTEPPPELLKPKATAVTASKDGGKSYALKFGGKEFATSVESVEAVPGGRQYTVIVDGSERLEILVENQTKKARKRKAGADAAGENTVVARMPGTIVKLLVAVGDVVEKGTVVAVLEAMKMQNEIKATVPGTVKELFVAEADSVETRAVLLELEPVPEP